MKILHTSDWHLGHRLHERSQHEEQAQFLDWLIHEVETEKVDLLLISGDIFDTSTPSNTTQKLYYDFLVTLRQTSCQKVVITAGNHDSPGVIEAPKEILQALDVYVVGRVRANVADEIFTLNINNETVHIAAIPYLRDQDIRSAVAGESFEQIEMRYRKAIANHFQNVDEVLRTKPRHFTVGMAHLFAMNTITSESEQNIYVGNLGHISASDFPTSFDYVALGHLHRPQCIARNEQIRYSGSPIAYSFSEAQQKKSVVIISVSNNTECEIKTHEIPTFRSMYRLECTHDDYKEALLNLSRKPHNNKPWIEIIIEQQEMFKMNAQEIQDEARALELDVLKVSLKNRTPIKGIEQLIDESKALKEQSPLEIFKLKCKEQSFNLNENQSIEDAFIELLNTTKQQ